MARHEVDLSKVPPADQRVQVREHPAIPEMPVAPGSQIKPETTQNRPVKPKLSVRNTPDEKSSSVPERMPVPPSSVYEEPPARVVASKDSHPE